MRFTINEHATFMNFYPFRPFTAVMRADALVQGFRSPDIKRVGSGTEHVNEEHPQGFNTSGKAKKPVRLARSGRFDSRCHQINGWFMGLTGCAKRSGERGEPESNRSGI